MNYVVTSDNADFLYYNLNSIGQTTSFTKTVTQPGNEGKIYRFRVAAQNVLGQGPWSDELQLMATNAPSTPTLTYDESTRTLTSVTLRFAPGSDNGGS